MLMSEIGYPFTYYGNMLEGNKKQPLYFLFKRIVEAMEEEKNMGYPNGRYFTINPRYWEKKVKNGEIDIPLSKKGDFKVSRIGIARTIWAALKREKDLEEGKLRDYYKTKTSKGRVNIHVKIPTVYPKLSSL